MQTNWIQPDLHALNPNIWWQRCDAKSIKTNNLHVPYDTIPPQPICPPTPPTCLCMSMCLYVNGCLRNSISVFMYACTHHRREGGIPWRIPKDIGNLRQPFSINLISSNYFQTRQMSQWGSGWLVYSRQNVLVSMDGFAWSYDNHFAT